MDSVGEITGLLRAHELGKGDALDALFQAVYEELKRLSRRELARVGGRKTLDSGALVHELYLKCAKREPAGWNDRRHFFGAAAKAMRHILIDYARQKSAAKRGGGEVACDSIIVPTDETTKSDPLELLALDRAMTRLEQLDAQLGYLVQLRFFAGLTVDDTATLLQVDPRTIRRHWAKARAFLSRELQA